MPVDMKSMKVQAQELKEQADRLESRTDYDKWEQRCDDYIKTLSGRNAPRKPRLSDSEEYSRVDCIDRLISLKHRTQERFVHAALTWCEIETAFQNRILTGMVLNSDYKEPRKFLEEARDIVVNRVQSAIQKHGSVKVNAIFFAEFEAGDKRESKRFDTKNRALFSMSDLHEYYDSYIVQPILESLERFEERDSGWTLNRILHLQININKYKPLSAGCTFGIPKWIQNKRAVVNVKSKDNACFAWSVVAALRPAKNNGHLKSSYPEYHEVLNTEGIQFPMTLEQIPVFERFNNISVNVYAIKETDKTVLPLRLTDNKRETHINLLYIEEDNVGHFALIKNLSRLVSAQLSRCYGRKYICDRCLHYFYTKEKLEAHNVDCNTMNDCKIVLPNDSEKWLRFKHNDRKERVPFVVYADLECILEKMDNVPKASTYAYQQHRTYNIGYYVRCSFNDSLSRYRCCRDTDCISWFVNELKELAHSVEPYLTRNVAMKDLSSEQEVNFTTATHCHICEQQLKEGDIRVRDHCHLTGDYRGPAHSNCNLHYKVPRFIPVIFHNLSGNDAHFIIKEVATAFEDSIEILPLANETYIPFTTRVRVTDETAKRKKYIQLRFIDSFKFLNASLDQLASFLSKDELKILRSQFRDEKDFDVLSRKGVFPYEYVDCAEKLEDSCLPLRDSFYSSLSGETVSEEDYAHAENVWTRFSVKTLGEYSDLYLKTDVLLLADVFENFRDNCLAAYELDPAYYYTLPGFAWDAMLKHTGVKLELLTDADIVMFVQRGKRGGLSQCSSRRASANNKYMRSYDSSKPSSYLIYFDVNNLYDWAMSEPLPRADFRWIDKKEFGLEKILAVGPHSPKGYIVEVDLEYPKELHDKHADLPLCPTRDKPPGKRQEKLLATLYDKKRYVMHYRSLQQCRRLGVRVTEIHRVLEFSQSPWLRGYIEHNTKLRASAKNEFEKNLYKLMNIAVFGKTLENVCNYVDVRLVTKWEGRYGAEAMIAKPNFHSRSVFSENLVAIEMRKLEVKLDKPIYVGMCVLDISKTRLYELQE